MNYIQDCLEMQAISIKGNSGTVKVAVPEGSISEGALRRAFQLEDEVAVGFYVEINCEKVYLSGEQKANDYIYKLPQDLNGRDFYLVWNEAKRSRMSTPKPSEERPPAKLNEKFAKRLSTRLFFMPYGQAALQNPARTPVEYVPPKDGEIDGGCVSPITSHAAVTYAHRSHKYFIPFTEGSDDTVNNHSVVEIRNCLDTNVRFRMKVAVVDLVHDFVILRSADDSSIFDDYPNTLRAPEGFEFFIGFGLSHATDDGQHLTHRNGRICSVVPDYRGRLLASSSIDGGDSGGPCYAADLSLIGIMVSSTATDPRLTSEYDSEVVAVEISNASSSPADTWITPGYLIMTAYMEYQAKHGRAKIPWRERGVKRKSCDALDIEPSKL